MLFFYNIEYEDFIHKKEKSHLDYVLTLKIFTGKYSFVSIHSKVRFNT